MSPYTAGARPVHSHSDEQILALVAGGSLEAFAELYDRYADRLNGLIFRIVKSKDEAEDVLQEVYSQLWRQAGRFEASRATAVVWILTIARSRALDHLRRRKRAPDAVVPAEQANERDACQEVSERESAGLVQGALGRLPEEQRLPIHLSFYGGLTHLEIARRTGLPLGTVKTRIRMGMRRMHVLLTQELKVV